jgi:hypothetical protein
MKIQARSRTESAERDLLAITVKNVSRARSVKNGTLRTVNPALAVADGTKKMVKERPAGVPKRRLTVKKLLRHRNPRKVLKSLPKVSKLSPRPTETLSKARTKEKSKRLKKRNLRRTLPYHTLTTWPPVTPRHPVSSRPRRPALTLR